MTTQKNSESTTPKTTAIEYQYLNLSANIVDPDTFYAKMIDMQAGLSDEDAQSAMSQLLLVLANHIGDMDVLLEAIDLVNNEMATKPNQD